MSTTHNMHQHDAQHINTEEGAEPNEKQPHGTSAIWRTFWILLVITILDIILYFVMPTGQLKNWTFIIFGIVKAYFIVGVFMHMKYEKLSLALMILVPVMFIVGLIASLLFEGNFWLSFF
jgi:cytochrome c oxidase subunit IV